MSHPGSGVETPLPKFFPTTMAKKINTEEKPLTETDDTLLNVLLIRFCKLLILAYGIRNRKCTKLWKYLTYNGYSIIGLAYYYIYSL